MSGITSQELFSRFCPLAAAPYCAALHQQHAFQLVVAKARKGKLGDYRYIPGKPIRYRISVNGNLNPYAFLLTYLHEVAHLVAFEQHGRRIRPHGKEWKQKFQLMMQPVLNETVFPSALLPVVQAYMQNPRASAGADGRLFQALREFDPASGEKILADVAAGEPFLFRGKVYEKGTIRRTRILCREQRSGKLYLFSSHAAVEILNRE